MELYHITNRGVDKRTIVEDDEDRIRFVHDLYMLNNKHNVNPNHRFKDVAEGNRTPLVAIHAWCLMSNHYHLLVHERIDGGMSAFMRKFNMGYAKYFNEKYTRSGYLWQGVYRRKLISRDAHFLHVPYYIHLNPLDFSDSEWRLGKVRDVKKAIQRLSEYRWSSYLDYIGLQNFPSLIDTSLLSEVLGARTRQEKQIASLISSRRAVLKNLSSELE